MRKTQCPQISACSRKSVPATFDGRLEDFGVREHRAPETTESERCLTDGRNYLWVYIDKDGFIGCLSRYGGNCPQKILAAVAEAFETDIVSEYQPQFWEFDTQEEWDAAMVQMAKKADDEFYIELLKYLRGEPYDIEPGTNGMKLAEIAKALVGRNASFLLPENKDKLLQEIDSIWRRELPKVTS
jgi:hypothetical protein